VLPLVQCAAADYRLRAETVVLLRKLGIDEASMLTFGGNARDEALSDRDLGNMCAALRRPVLTGNHLRRACSCHGKFMALRPTTGRLLQEQRLRLTLTDHNSMTPRQKQLGLPSAVVQIIDHHTDDGDSSHVVGADRVIGYGRYVRPEGWRGVCAPPPALAPVLRSSYCSG
jgi:hypothetical protein